MFDLNLNPNLEKKTKVQLDEQTHGVGVLGSNFPENNDIPTKLRCVKELRRSDYILAKMLPLWYVASLVFLLT